MKKKLGKRTDASSILEVIVALLLLMIIFGTAIMIYGNVLRYSVSVKKIKAEAILHRLLEEASTEGIEAHPAVEQWDDIRIEQQQIPYPDAPGLTEIHLTAYDQNNKKITIARALLPVSLQQCNNSGVYHH